MIIKVERPNNTTDTIECQRVKTYLQADAKAGTELVILAIFDSNDSIELVEKNADIWIMNDQGRTIDHLIVSPDEAS